MHEPLLKPGPHSSLYRPFSLPSEFACKVWNCSRKYKRPLTFYFFQEKKFADNYVGVNQALVNVFRVCFRKIAKKIDVNGDDSISEEELKKWVKENHMKYLLKNAKDYIADVDLNNDSMMSFKEYEDSHFVPGRQYSETK